MPASGPVLELSADLEPWERQPGETSKAWHAFTVYRDQPNRSIKRTARELGHKAPGTVAMWSTNNKWQERAYQYDLHKDREHRAMLAEHRLRMVVRQLRTSQLAQQKIAEWLMNLDPTRLSAHSAAIWYDTAVKVERQAAGESDKLDITMDATHRIDSMTPEQMEARLRDIHSEIGRVIDGANG